MTKYFGQVLPCQIFYFPKLSAINKINSFWDLVIIIVSNKSYNFLSTLLQTP